MTECARCGNRVPEGELASLQPINCPHCGAPLLKSNQSVWMAGLRLVGNYFRDIWHILTRPVSFFRTLPIQGGIAKPLTFALVTHWLGSALSLLWHVSLGSSVQAYFLKFYRAAGDWIDFDLPQGESSLPAFRDKIVNWLTGVGPVLIDPFLTVISILVTGLFVFIGARILVSPGKEGHPQDISYESAVRIICFGMTPAIFHAIPILGGAFASIGVLIYTVLGAREVYRVGSMRAILIALFPKILFLGIISIGLLIILFAVIQFFTAFWM